MFASLLLWFLTSAAWLHLLPPLFAEEAKATKEKAAAAKAARAADKSAKLQRLVDHLVRCKMNHLCKRCARPAHKPGEICPVKAQLRLKREAKRAAQREVDRLMAAKQVGPGGPGTCPECYGVGGQHAPTCSRREQEAERAAE